MKQEKMLEKILQWAKENDSVKLIIQTGSFARKDNSADDLSDLDLEIFVNNVERYSSSNNWIKEIQNYWVILPLVNTVGDPTRLVIFDDGIKVDFTLNKVEDFHKIIEKQSDDNYFNKGYKVIIDKDNLTENFKPPTFKSQFTPKPTQEEFTALIEEFWFEAYHIPKYLKRNSLWIVKFRNWTMKQLLLRIIEWYEKSIHGWDYDTWDNGVRMEKWAEKDLYEEFNNIFAHFDKEDSMKALEAMLSLFRKVGKETATNLNLSYPKEVDKNITSYINSLK